MTIRRRRGYRRPGDGQALRAAEPRIPASAGLGVWLWCWAAGQALSAPLILAWGPADGDAVAVWLIALTSLIAWATYLVGMCFVSRRSGMGRFVEDFGVRWRRRDVLGIGIGVVVQLVLVPLAYLPLQALWSGVFTDERLKATAEGMVDNAGGVWFAVLLLTIAVGAPIVEELVYRGLVQGSLATRFNDGVAWIVTALLFTAIHFRPYEYPGLLVFSLVVGAAAMRTRRLGLAVMIHVGFNATGLALAYS